MGSERMVAMRPSFQPWTVGNRLGLGDLYVCDEEDLNSLTGLELRISSSTIDRETGLSKGALTWCGPTGQRL
ncbi:MAG: hypothetical protein DI547_15760 [Sphingobium sp.]|nr:MAG: hypothetical protein DI547_15760 [Sphingobium sp.]